jgi:thiol-disulfide isomerase/thioredoxin
MVACCLGLAGCSLFGKKASTKPANPPPDVAGSAWPPRAEDTPTPTRTTPTPGSGILAGRVLDSYDRKPPATFIQVVASDEPGAKSAAPIEVATDAQGYFTIYDLKPGRSYELIARTRDGSPKLAGRTWAKPPNPRVLIFISEDFATPNTPAAPGPPNLPGAKPASPTNSLPGPSGQDSAGGPSADAGRDPGRAAGILGPPVRTDDNPPASAPASSIPAAPRAEVHPENVAAEPDGLARRSPTLEIRGPADKGPPPAPRQVAPATAALPAVVTPVPYCELTGKQLYNFALYDINGQRFEYRNHRGKLVLLDVWGTWCPPCLAAIPHLNILYQNYAEAGLEVIGIDYERVGTPQERLRRVEGVRDRLGIQYRLLMGVDSATCPVRRQFEVRAFPTLVLLDENNRIIWKEEGLDEGKLQELTTLIQWKLRKQ